MFGWKRKFYMGCCVGVLAALLCACDTDEAKQTALDTYDKVSDMIDDTIESVNLPEPKEVESISGDRYVYNLLDEETRICYDQILDCILSYDEYVTLSTVDYSVIEAAFKAVFADYGGLFWVDGYSYKTYQRRDKIIGVTFNPKYTMSVSEKNAYQAQVDAVVEAWLSEIPQDVDDYGKAKFVFETLIEKADYDTSSENNQNILSVFLGGRTVCQGYADATSYLLDELGVSSTVISGTANGEAHAWNLVKLDGAYYFIDTTFGNSRYTDAQANTVKHVNYAYLNVTTDEMSRNHVVTSEFEIPLCTSMVDNYYCREGLFFSTFNAPAIGAVFAKGYNGGAEASSVKLADDELYEKVKKYFITDGHITEYCNDIRSVTYLESVETRVLTIEW